MGKNITINLIDSEKVQKAYNETMKAMSAFDAIEKRLTDKYNKQVEYKLHEIAENVIDEFYDYPTEYARKGDLYNTYKIDTKNGEWSIDIDSKYM